MNIATFGIHISINFNLQTKNIMKKTFLYFCLLFIVQTAFAADSLYVREQQIPILIDRIDNVLYEMRIPAQKGDVRCV